MRSTPAPATTSAPRPSFDLQGVAAAEGEAEGEAEGPTVARPAVMSATVVEAPLGDLLTEESEAVVLAPDPNGRSGEAGEVAARGEIGGVRSASALLAVGLREQAGSGAAGIATLAPDQTGDVRAREPDFVAPRPA